VKYVEGLKILCVFLCSHFLMSWFYRSISRAVGPPSKLEPLAWHGIVAGVFSVLLALVGFYRGLSALSELHLQVSMVAGCKISLPGPVFHGKKWLL
jgi:hypothetical protein